MARAGSRRAIRGNPFGRALGARNKATEAAELLLDGEVEVLTRRAVELALDGQIGALRLCLPPTDGQLLYPRTTKPRRSGTSSSKMPMVWPRYSLRGSERWYDGTRMGTSPILPMRLWPNCLLGVWRGRKRGYNGR